MKKTIWFIGFFLLASICSFAQVSFTAKANRYKVGKNEQFTVDFKVNDSGKQFQAPDFGGLRVSSGPNQSSTSYIDNYGMRQNLSFSYVLSGSKPGKYTIGSASIQVDGKTYKTEPIRIEVTEKSSRPNDPNDPYSVAASSAFMKVQVNKTSAYQGEPIIASYKLYYSVNIGRYEVLERPSLTGFYQENIELKSQSGSSERYGDKSYQTGIIEQVLLIPQKSGKLKPGTLEVRLPTSVPTNRRDIFGRRMTQKVNQTSEASFPTLNIKPLPEKGKPNSFDGAVGNFNMDVSLSREQVNANESVTLKIKLSGKGNIKLIESPKPEIPSAFEVYDPKFTERVSVSAAGMNGSKTYEYLLIPRYNGTYKIAPISFSYFDPKKEEYKTITSEAFEIEVIGGATNPGTTANTGGNPAANKENVSLIGNDILYIKTKAGSFTEKGDRFFKTTSFYAILTALLVLPFGMIGFSFVNKNRNTDTKKVKQGKAGKVARKHLAEAQKMLESNANDAFYLALSSAIWGYFSDKLSIPQSKISKDNIVEALKSKGVQQDLIDKALDLMNRAEMARFAIAGESSTSQDYEETVTVITEIEKQIG